MAEISNFIKTIMAEDLESGKVSGIITRFPPEPNAYLHIGHARALVTNFELAKSFGGFRRQVRLLTRNTLVVQAVVLRDRIV